MLCSGRLFLLLALFGLTIFGTADAYAESKRVVDLRLDTFQTGLQAIGWSMWVDDNHFIVTTLEEGAEEHVTGTPSRVALVDFKNKTIKYIARNAEVMSYSFDRNARSFFVGHVHRTEFLDAQGRMIKNDLIEYEDLRELRIQPGGEIIEVKRYPPGSSPRSSMADKPKELQPSYRSLDDGAGGFLFEKSKNSSVMNWVRRGKDDVEVRIRWEEIDGGEYLPFLDKYLVGWSWKLDKPLRLLAQDGKIEEVPYPKFIAEYGIGDRARNGFQYSNLTLTRRGIVVRRQRENGVRPAIFLYRQDRLYRVAAGTEKKASTGSLPPADGIWSQQLSPDGCKIAYQQRRDADRGKYDAPRFFAIIDMCSEGVTPSPHQPATRSAEDSKKFAVASNLMYMKAMVVGCPLDSNISLALDMVAMRVFPTLGLDPDDADDAEDEAGARAARALASSKANSCHEAQTAVEGAVKLMLKSR